LLRLRSALQLLQISELDYDDRDSTERIAAAGTHLVGLINELINTALIKRRLAAPVGRPRTAVPAYREGGGALKPSYLLTQVESPPWQRRNR